MRCLKDRMIERNVVFSNPASVDKYPVGRYKARAGNLELFTADEQAPSK